MHRLFVASLSLAVTLSGQSLVKDINPVAGSQSLSSSPSNGAEGFGETLFAADDGIHGRELWRTDGTAAGTWLVADINPGPASSNPSRPVWLNGHAIFAADDGAHGVEPWDSDGTAAGTHLVADIRPGSASSSPMHMTSVVAFAFASFFFSADDGVHGRELWQSNTTAAGTLMTVDLRAGATGSMSATSEIWDDPAGQTNVGYFTANNGVLGEELWKITPTGVALVRDINPGAASSNPALIMSTSPRLTLLFAATRAADGREPWHVDDGAADLAADVNPGAASSNPTSAVPSPGSFPSPVFLVNGTGATAGNELWRVEIGSGVTLLKNINASSASSDPVLWAESGLANRVLLAATSATSGRELWASDGTSVGTVLLRDINPGTASSNPSEFINVDVGSRDYVLFAANDGVAGEELWITDKFAPSTQLLKDCAPGAASSMPRAFSYDDSTSATFALFSLQDATHGFELWISSATAASTVLLEDIRGPVVSSTPRELTTLGTASTVCFAAGEPTFGTELWKTDATTGGTVLVKDIKPGSDGSGPQGLFFALGKLFFAADDGSHGLEPWVSDGTTAGTVLLADIAGNGSSVPHSFTRLGDHVYFGASDNVTGFEVWRTDGTTAGTTRVTDLEPGAQGGNPNGLVASAGKLFFAATTSAHGTELWMSDGTAAGTALVKDINVGTASAGPNGVLKPFAWNSLVLFGADSGSGDLDLWRSDGTAAGTFLIGDLDGTDGPGEFAAAGSRVFFAATFGRYGRELWTTLGTLASTQMVKDIAGSAGSGDPVGITRLGVGVVFAAETSAAGRELWTSDGTDAGTVLVKDINPGAVHGLVIPNAVTSGRRCTMTSINGQNVVYFAATDHTYGIELWRTDGTTAGTLRVGDVNQGGAGSRPSPLARCGSSLVLAADGGAIGIELYRIAAPASWNVYGVACRGGLGLLPQISASGAPEIGNAAFAITVTDARPSTGGAMLVGFGALSLPLGGGCSLLVDLFGPSLSLPLATNARGDGAVAFPIPANINLDGLQAFAQAALADLGGSYGGVIAVSDGVQVFVQR